MKNLKVIGAMALMAVIVPNSTYADTLLLDRGLPTANLNNAAGANRANVAWADGENPGTAPFAPGDSFMLSTSANVTDIRVWEVGGSTTGLSLLGGVAGSSINTISSSYTATSVTYAGGSTYQGSSGNFLPIYQLDFSVALALTSGQTFDFFLDGQPDANNQSPFLHASNAGLSGSPQAGADGTFLFYDPNTLTVDTWDSGTGAGTYDPGVAGWDKNSDGNVQVFGSVPDHGSTLILGAIGLGALFIAKRKLIRT